jgi:hypothetical protein
VKSIYEILDAIKYSTSTASLSDDDEEEQKAISFEDAVMAVVLLD